MLSKNSLMIEMKLPWKCTPSQPESCRAWQSPLCYVAMPALVSHQVVGDRNTGIVRLQNTRDTGSPKTRQSGPLLSLCLSTR